MDTKPIIDTVSLTIKDLPASLDFYQKNLGLHLHSNNGGKALLGSAEKAFLELVENPNAKRYRSVAGLYHFAVLLPTRVDLARILRHLIEMQTPLQGLSDHGVSEAIYLPDPDGNGIEIYRDRPQDEWPTINGELQMVTESLDVDGLLAEIDAKSNSFGEIPDKTYLGHIHLHVGKISNAEKFYTDALGFDLMQRYGNSASFLSRNGYHHHIGINTWNGTGASLHPDDAIGLRWFSLQGGDDLIARVKASDVGYEESQDGVFVHDPFGNGIMLK
ncbi:MAG: VOC family protein [Anaerolineales bacterium]|nr:VOC family protein [Chloroflexota bacterium]MBL6981826.1 VOC family protein [Anaerolineales bacterium]